MERLSLREKQEIVKGFRDEITRLSGSGKRVVSTRRNGIYSSMTLPGLDDMEAVRDTIQRFADFDVPEDLTGKTVLDIGSNVGAVSFEAARRGAKVYGLEFRQDRVDLCNEIAKFYRLDAEFYQADFNAEEPGVEANVPCTDITFCCSVTEYIDDLISFYGYLGLCTDMVLYLEDNKQRDWEIEDTLIFLYEHGKFDEADYIGNGHSGGISRKRKLFVASKETR